MNKDVNNRQTASNSPLLKAIEKLDLKLDLLTQDSSTPSDRSKNNSLKIKQGKLVAESGTLQAFLGKITALFLPESYRKKQDEVKQAQKGLMQDVEDVQRYLEWIQKWKDEGDTKLANYAIEVINRYNSIIGNPDENNPSIYSRIYNFFDDDQNLAVSMPKIELTKQSHSVMSTLKRSFHDLKNFNPSTTATQLKQIFSSSPTHMKQMQLICDIYYLRAHKLVHETCAKEHAVEEVRKWIKETRIEIIDETGSNVITLQQYILRPGYNIFIEATFTKCLSDTSFHMPRLESIRAEVDSRISDFPLSNEHTGGMTFVVPLTKARPLNPNETPLYKNIDQLRNHLSEKLTTDPVASRHAIQLANLKKEVFNANKEHFIDLQRQLLTAIYLRAKKDMPIAIDHFFDHLLTLENPYEVLAQTNQYFMYVTLIQPSDLLNKQWLEGGLTQANHDERTALAREIMHGHAVLSDVYDDQRIYLDYFSACRELLEGSLRDLFIFIHSEKYNCAPPEMNEFQHCLLRCAFSQLHAYILQSNTLLGDSKDENCRIVYNLLEDSLKKEKAIFSGDSENKELEDLITDELSMYIYSRSQ